ncbi:MAG: response regulator [bacterium]|nr:response regulator [bacterium]
MQTQIVIAEDSAVQAVILRRALENHGYQVTWAKDGAAGLAKVIEIRPALVITDVEMPVMNGFDFCVAVKSNPELTAIPVILCTSLSQPEDIIRGMEAGADGYVTKPYDEKYLMYRVRALLDNPYGPEDAEPVDITYAGNDYVITAGRRQILNLLLSTYENTVKQYGELINAQMELKRLNQDLDASFRESERLLINILPEGVARQLKKEGQVTPQHYDSVTVLFTDFQSFTQLAERMTPAELVRQLDSTFSFFDSAIERFGLEKLKTIGDSFMCAGGIPEANATHAVDAVLAALEIQEFMRQVKDFRKLRGDEFWDCRIGISTGPLVAGVVGSKKFAYDVWGDTVNMASRMESSGEIGRINISESTYELVDGFFACEERGRVQAKNKGEVLMYFVDGILPELSVQGAGQIPNEEFRARLEAIRNAFVAETPEQESNAAGDQAPESSGESEAK